MIKSVRQSGKNNKEGFSLWKEMFFLPFQGGLDKKKKSSHSLPSTIFDTLTTNVTQRRTSTAYSIHESFAKGGK